MIKNLLTILLILTTIFSFPIIAEDETNFAINNIKQSWTGIIRIEGKSESIWTGQITFTDSNITAENISSGLMESYYIPYPSILGGLNEASKQAGFSFHVLYYPEWDAFYVQTIAGDSDWWHYWVDYNLPMVGAGKYELTDEDDEILWGYLENWEAHALKISIDKIIVKKNEEFTVSVFNETGFSVENATVFVGSHSFFTDNNGKVTIKLSESGNFEVFSEKEDFVRSEKLNLIVKTKTVSIEKSLTLLKIVLMRFPKFQNLIKICLDYYR